MAISQIETRPIAHESVQLTEENIVEVAKWLHPLEVIVDLNHGVIYSVRYMINSTTTIRVKPGDWITREKSKTDDPYLHDPRVYTDELYRNHFRSVHPMFVDAA
jgi:hypothetical protein